MKFSDKREKEEKKENLNRKEIGKIIVRAKGNRRVPLQTIILGTLYVTGALAAALVAQTQYGSLIILILFLAGTVFGSIGALRKRFFVSGQTVLFI